jgi:hypothetical protein
VEPVNIFQQYVSIRHRSNLGFIPRVLFFSDINIIPCILGYNHAHVCLTNVSLFIASFLSSQDQNHDYFDRLEFPQSWSKILALHIGPWLPSHNIMMTINKVKLQRNTLFEDLKSINTQSGHIEIDRVAHTPGQSLLLAIISLHYFCTRNSFIYTSTQYQELFTYFRNLEIEHFQSIF